MIIFISLPNQITISIKGFKPVFWWESIGFIAMGIAWLTKGELIFAAPKLDADMN
jgi:hypothetical protein